MQIQSVTYSRLVSTGRYENAKTGATARVEDGETPEEALVKLREWVTGQLDATAEESAELRERRCDLNRVEAELDRAKIRWERAKGFLAKHGLMVSADDDISF